MIIIQTPLRVSLFGGGTDFESYFAEHGGCVLTSAIDKYVFVTIKKRFDRLIRVGWTRAEMVDTLDEIQHELIREALRKTGIKRGVEITTMADIPTAGSGLGSSSTVTVGALHAAYTYQRQLILSERLAKEACEIEIDILGKPIGMQDQYIAAYGGFCFIEFRAGAQPYIEYVRVDDNIMRELNNGLMLFFTGITRKADKILSEQKANIRDRLSVLADMKEIAYTARTCVEAGDIAAIGTLLHESWQLKKQLAGAISNHVLDDYYELARDAGATGGKITGAGGGGFLLLYCPIGQQNDVRRALRDLQELPFQLGQDGSKVIFDYQR